MRWLKWLFSKKGVVIVSAVASLLDIGLTYYVLKILAPAKGCVVRELNTVIAKLIETLGFEVTLFLIAPVCIAWVLYLTYIGWDKKFFRWPARILGVFLLVGRLVIVPLNIYTVVYLLSL